MLIVRLASGLRLFGASAIMKTPHDSEEIIAASGTIGFSSLALCAREEAMPRGNNLFKMTDLKRALQAAKDIGIPVDVEITKGKMTVVTKDAACVPSTTNPWDKPPDAPK
jgi:hypothetical protein